MISNYCDLESMRQYMTSGGKPLPADAQDDALLSSLLETASRYIDGDTHRTFYPRTETHYYDLPDGLSLYIDDDDLLSVTTLTNGDGIAILPAGYNLYPLNKYPKHEIRLKWSQNVYWQWSTAGDSDAVITLLGQYGYSFIPPKDIATLTMALAHNLYKSRFGEGVVGAAKVTAAGVVITPGDVPEWGANTLDYYRRLV